MSQEMVFPGSLVSYEGLFRSGEMRERIERALAMLASCRLCPRGCKVDRLAGETGECRTGRYAVVSSYGPHFGEESPLVGHHGSGTIFFSYCNLKCVFCQNYALSQLGEGRQASKDEIAGMMLALQRQGCHNINLVSPSHVVPQVLEALGVAVEIGLSLPLVYNTGGYDALVTLKLLEGVIDIYMPDMKYAEANIAETFSGVRNYPAVNRSAVKEMHRQVGDLQLDNEGVATRGLLVRHLVLPHGLAGTEEVVRFLARDISRHTYLNVMAQYRPCYQAHSVAPLSRPVTREEFLQAVEMARQAGLRRLDKFYYPSVARLLL